MNTIYEQLEREALPQMTHYHDDLRVIDREMIEAFPGVPFLHWTSKMHTYLIMLNPMTDTTVFPPYGQRRKYLFDYADRDHVLNEKVTMAEYHTRPANSPHNYTCRYYNGTTLKVIPVEKAVEIAKSYAKPIKAAWHTEWLKYNRPWEFRAVRDAELVPA